MDSELIEFISHLDDDVPFSPYQQLNDMWRELEDYFDRSYFDIDQYLDELLPSVPPASATVEYDIPIDEPQLMTEEKLFQSLTIPETFFKDLIVNPPVPKDQNVVTTEILLRTVRSKEFSYTGRHYEHPFKDFVLDRGSPAAPLQNDGIADCEMTLTPLMSSTPEWLSILRKQQLLPGVTADAMAQNILNDKSVIPPPQAEIMKVIQKLFTGVNTYIARLSTEFGDHKFFTTPQFEKIAHELQLKIISHSTANENSLRDVLLHWMETVTASFALINDQRRSTEEKVSEKIINEAVAIYRRRLMLSNPNEENVSILYKKEVDIICQGIRQTYADCEESFTAGVVTELEKRLNNESSSTTEPSICHINSTDSDDFQVIVSLLVSEYASNIKQKGLQCASISTLKQFDDINATCLKDAHHNFDRKTTDVPLAERDQLKEQLRSKLESESNCKRLEFTASRKASLPQAVSSASSLTRSVGIHFGFEKICVSYYDRVGNRFQTIYGPVANVVSFTSEGISIGLIPSDAVCLNMEKLLTTLNVDFLHDTKVYGKLKVESIVALLLMYIDEMTKQILPTTSNIRYTVAIPSCLNDVMRNVFETAIKIANIDCQLVREQCALTTNFIRANHQVMTKNKDEYVVAMTVNERNSCDSVVYAIAEGMILKVLGVSGSDDNRRFVGVIGNTGIQHELNKIQSKCNTRIRFLICCNDRGIVGQIKNRFQKSKVHELKFDSNRLAEGAALLCYVADDDCSLECSFNIRNLTSLKRSASGVTYRLEHTTSNSNIQNLAEVSTQFRSLIDFQMEELSESKAVTKQIILGKMKDLEESRLAGQMKRNFRQSLKQDLKAVDEELMNKRVIEDIAGKWRKEQF